MTSKNELSRSENEILNVFLIKSFFYEPNIIIVGWALARKGLGVCEPVCTAPEREFFVVRRDLLWVNTLRV
jgi:hypothetical protein